MPDSRVANQTTAEATTVSLPPVASLLDDHTPPDAVSQCMLAIPMILLYEVAAQLARLVKPKKPAEA